MIHFLIALAYPLQNNLQKTLSFHIQHVLSDKSDLIFPFKYQE